MTPYALQHLDAVHASQVLATLPDRQAMVIVHRYGLLGHVAIGRRAAARAMGVTLTRLDQLEAIAVRKLERRTP